MGSGAADGVVTPDQPGVIRREGENFPIIPPKLLKLSPDELQRRIDYLHTAITDNDASLFPSLDHQERLGESITIYQFAKTAVERNLLTPSA